jgi:hypothetical protein
LAFEVDTYTNPGALYDSLRARLEAEGPMMTLDNLAPVVEISLEGILAFDRSELDLDYIGGLVKEIVSPLFVRLRHDRIRSTEFEIAAGEYLDRTELERAVLHELILRDARYRDQADDWASIIAEVKEMVLNASRPETIVATVRQRMNEMDQE